MYNSQELSNKIKLLAKKKDITISKMLAECGLNPNTLNQISETRGISSFSLAKIADKLDCSVDYLLGRTEDPDSVTEKQLSDIIKIYNQLDEIGKAKLLIAADDILKGK